MRPVICKDCKHVRAVRDIQPGGITYVYYWCAKTEVEEPEQFDPVVGPKPRDSTATWCHDERSEHGTCGPEGRLFERASLISRLLLRMPR